MSNSWIEDQVVFMCVYMKDAQKLEQSIADAGHYTHSEHKPIAPVMVQSVFHSWKDCN